MSSGRSLLAGKSQVGPAARPRLVRSVVSVRASAEPQIRTPAKRPTIPEPPMTPELANLAATAPNNFSIKFLNGGKYAKQKLPTGDLYWIADPAATSVWLADEWGNGVRPGWPQSLRQLIGNNAINTTSEFKIYRKTRDIIDANILSDDAFKRALPDIAKKVEFWADAWAKRSAASPDKLIKFHPQVRFLVMDVVMNVALRLNLTAEEVETAATLSAQWAGGIVPNIDASDATKKAFASGMAARDQLSVLYKKKLSAKDLPTGIASGMRDAFGVDNESTLNTCFAFTFAGLETSSSVVANLIRHLAAHPDVAQKIKKEAADVRTKHKGLASIPAQNALAYTYAAVRETLRTTYAVGAVPKIATLPLDKPEDAAALPGKCPFQAAWKAMSVLDPTVKGQIEVFKPERWLDKKNMENWNIWQNPFGSGTRECPGARVMQAIAALTAVELTTKYKITADGNTTFSNIGVPINGLPGTIARA